MTSPGQMEHEEGLTDSLLMSARKKIADAAGTLHFFVRSPQSVAPSVDSAGLGLTGLPQSPFGKASFDKPLDPATYAKLVSDDSEPSSTMRSGESTLVPEKFRLMQTLEKDTEAIKNDLTLLQENMLQQDFQNLPEENRLALLEAKKIEHRKETERKQKAYFEQRRSRLSGEASGTLVHDFDIMRDQKSSRPMSSDSVEPERKTDTLVPMRKPPAVPERSML